MMHQYSSPPAQIPKITHVFLDFDGVMTDNTVTVDNKGNESVRCSKWDSWAIWQAKKRGYEFIVISLETGKHVKRRCKKLGIDCYQGVENKDHFLVSYLKRREIPRQQVAYIGNDLADIGAMRTAGLGACPIDSHPDVLRITNHVMNNKGGDGAIREFCDKFLP
jgi:YrbI family 3-deoxy-D-manno-octulosonate 8-phosphate phosphatase|tara:strand:+ start:33484 stop:33975 length:492 start_codon:yes stop_codon:yes gene_type:complete